MKLNPDAVGVAIAWTIIVLASLYLIAQVLRVVF